jgi:predicted anti-sigma-YlaC factor YlaD
MNFSLSPCEKLKKQAVAMLCGETSFLEKQWMDSHIRQCTQCRQSLDEISELLEITRAQRFLPSPNARDRMFVSMAERIECEEPVNMHLWKVATRPRISLKRIAIFVVIASSAIAAGSALFLSQ